MNADHQVQSRCLAGIVQSGHVKQLGSSGFAVAVPPECPRKIENVLRTRGKVEVAIWPTW